MDVQTAMVSVIIVSYNTRELTLECLHRLMADIQHLDAEVLVVDNASTDGSAEAIEAAFPQTRVFRMRENLGFGAANNLAMSQARGDVFLLLNSDAFVHPGTVRALTDTLRRLPKAAVVGPRLLNADGSLQPSCYRFPTPFRAWLENLWISAAVPNHDVFGDYRRWDHRSERSVDFVSGACFLVRRSVYEQVGGFDERFFMYSEETDWQRRMRDAGWSVHFTPDAVVTHLGGASGASEKARINRHFFDSLDYYERKHHGLSGLISVRLAMAIGCLLRAPLWAGVAVLNRHRREQSVSKLRLYSWLLLRQLTHFRIGHPAS